MNQNNDNYIFNKLIEHKLKNKITSPVGYVQIFIDDKCVDESYNLVVGLGRAFTAQRIFNITTTEFYQQEPDYTNHIVSHFAIGAGGSVITSNDNYTLQGPHICDEHLYRPISLGDLTYLNEKVDYYEEDNPYFHNQYCIKPLQEKVLVETRFPTQPIEENSICSYFTRIRCICRVNSGEPGLLEDGHSVQISEAGLYAVNEDENLEDRNPVMFAHVCFSPKFKEKEKTFGLKWNILC
ncbi:MAG: hypothetical protein ACOC33_00685 [bacterium]